MHILLLLFTLTAQDARPPLAYTVSGEGRPLLLLPGLGTTGDVFTDLVTALPPGIQSVRLEVPGVGEGRMTPPFTWEELNAAAIETMARLGHQRFDVLGLSWGSFWAQKLALAHSDKVGHLILVGGSAGGKTHVAPAPEVLQALLFPSEQTLESQQRVIAMAFHPDWLSANPERLRLIAQARLDQPFPAASRSGQLTLALGFDTTAELPGLQTPTMILHGAEDLVVPTANGEHMATLIPNAKLVVLKNSGHICLMDQAKECAKAIAEFLQVN